MTVQADSIFDLSAEMHEPQRRRLQPYRWSELGGLPKRQYLVKGLLDCQAMSVVYGPSNCGKTFLALDISLCVALGWSWRGMKVRQGAVLYIAAEGGLGIAERLEAFRQRHGLEVDQVPFLVLPTAIDLCSRDGDTADLIAEIEAADTTPSLVVVDTLSRALAGGNENSAEDMGRFIRNCDRIRNKTSAHVLIVHHTGKDESRGSRGHSSLKAATDTEIEVSKDDVSGIATATVRKQRDAIGGDIFAFKMEQVELGTDSDGDRITSCVVVPEDAPARIPNKCKLSPKQQRAMDALHNCLADAGKPAPGTKDYPSGINVVGLEHWRESLFKAGVLDKDAANPRQDFRRLKEQLKNRRAIGEWDGLVWAVNVAGLGV